MKLRIPAKGLPGLLFLSGLTLIGYCVFVFADAAQFQQKAAAAVEPSPPAAPPPYPVTGLVGRLDIRRLGISVAVLEGTTATTLRRAAGHIAGTALPGESGNIGISAHRDTFFYPLRNVRLDDLLSMTTRAGSYSYRVSSITIVQPGDSALLTSGSAQALTLVTCYPFTFIGAAPERFLVRAERIL